MGLRNPFRFAVNRTNGDVYIGDYSPDSPEPNPLRGPAGHGRWMLIRQPGNYGWPFCVTPDLPYVDYDFATGASGAPFDCAAPVNDSRHNTGLRRLPAVDPAGRLVHVPGLVAGVRAVPRAVRARWAGTASGRWAARPTSSTRANRSQVKWPRYYDGQPLFYEWTRDYIKEFRLNRPNGSRLVDIRHVPVFVDNPMDMEFGPDGALYVLEYGDGFFAENPDAQLARIDFVRGNRTPVPVASAVGHADPNEPLIGLAPLTVTFSSAGTTDSDGDRLSYAWDFDADGIVDSRERNPTFTYTENGVFDATLRVTDRTGRTAAASVR